MSAIKLPTVAVTAAPATQGGIAAPFTSIDNFETAQRMAQALVTADLVPEAYRGPKKIGNVLIAMQLAARMNADLFFVMQHLHVIQGRPSWSSAALIAMANRSGRYRHPLRFHFGGEAGTPDRSCYAWTVDRSGERIEGPPVSLQMAHDEGWVARKGSKWPTMPEVMLRYRAAAFFVRFNAPELAMGLHTSDEVEDIGDAVVVESPDARTLEDLNAEVMAAAQPAESTEPCAHGDVVVADDGAQACVECGEVVAAAPAEPEGPTAKEVADMIGRAQTADDLELAEDLLSSLDDADAETLRAPLAAAHKRLRT